MAWDLISVSTYAEVASGNLTLNSPADAQRGGLLVARITYRSNVAFTPNDSTWQLVASIYGYESIEGRPVEGLPEDGYVYLQEMIK